MPEVPVSVRSRKQAPLTLSEIAARIDVHLKRFEKDPEINRYRNPNKAQEKLHPYFLAVSWANGKYVRVCYVSYQGNTHLSKEDALRYLAWLDAGHVGRHYEAVK